MRLRTKILPKKRTLTRIFSIYLKLFICIQLSLFPVGASQAQTQPPSESSINSLRYPEELEKARDFNTNVESLRNIIFKPDSTAPVLYKNHPLDTFSLLEQTVDPVNKEGVTFPKHVPLESLTIEVIQNGRQDGKSYSAAFLNRSGNLPIDPTIEKLFTGKSFITLTPPKEQITTSENLYSFTLNYKGKKIHTFPNHIKWIAFLDTYILFLEPARMSDTRAFISFIDLKYFKALVGHGPLPIFSMPIPFNESIVRQSIENPSSITTNKEGIHIGNLQITKDQISVFSKIHQMVYNVVVSFLNKNSANETQKLTAEIIRVFINSLTNKTVASSPAFHSREAYTLLENIIREQLSARQNMGSIKDPSGTNQQLQEVKSKLSEERPLLSESDKKTLEQFSEHLKKDTEFQTVLESTSSILANETKIKHRFMLLFSHLASGTNKLEATSSKMIQVALGTIANTALPGETIGNRINAFYKKSRQTLFSKSGLIGTSVLVGLGSIAHPETGIYLNGLLHMGTSILFEFLEMGAATWNSFSAGFTGGLQKAYGGENFPIFKKALMWLFGAILLTYSTLHISSFWNDYKKFLNSKDSKKHDKEVESRIGKILNHFKVRFNINNFIDYTNTSKHQHIEAQTHSNQMRWGIPTTLILPDGSRHQISLQTQTLWDVFKTHFNNSSALDAQIKLTDKKTKAIIKFIDLLSLQEYENLNTPDAVKNKDKTITIEIQPSANERFKRVFRIIHGTPSDISSILKTSINDGSNSSATAAFSNSNRAFNMSGEIIPSELTEEQKERLETFFEEIENTRWYKFKQKLRQVFISSKTEITTLRRATWHFITSSAQWAASAKGGVKFWNQFFLYRHIHTQPRLTLYAAWYSNFFNRIYNDGTVSTATVFNGAYDNRLLNLTRRIRANVFQSTKIQDALKTTHEFENTIIPIEQEYKRISTELAFLETLKYSLQANPKAKGMDYSVQTGSHIDPLLLHKKEQLFFETYQRSLFMESLRDYLKEQAAIPPDWSDKQIRNHIIERLLENPDSIELRLETPQEIRNRILRITKQENLIENTYRTVQTLFDFNFNLKNLTERFQTRNRVKQERLLNPKANITMRRYQVTKELIEDNRQTVRSTRKLLTTMLFDKPAELAILFFLMAGVEQGILKVLHEEMFSEQAWFHLSRYTIWHNFFLVLILGLTANIWIKVQVDSRLESTGALDTFPKKEDIAKRFGFLRWFMKNAQDKDNTIMKNYKNVLFDMVLPNILPAFSLILFMHVLTLGRFDLDIYINEYLAFFILFIITALPVKIENAFEKSIGWRGRKLIEKFNLQGKDRAILNDPKVIQYLEKQGIKLRFLYNLIYFPFFENPVGGSAEFGKIPRIFIDGDTIRGSRTFQRVVTTGKLASEYLSNGLDWMYEHTPTPKTIAKGCKALFKRGRTDYGE